MARKIRVWWHNPPGVARLTITHGDEERELGPRGVLTFQEAAAVLDRPVTEVRRAITAAFLRSTRGGVTVQAALDFLREERADARAADRVMRRVRAGKEQMIPIEQLGWNRRR
jgi:phosphohistidine phosphatase SixA